DLRTFPGLERAAPAYDLTRGELERRLTEFNPIDRIGVLIQRRVPALFIHGDDDKIVPIEANSFEFAARYRNAGAGDLVKVVVAKGQGHNLWEGFFHCRELVDFAVDRARAGAEPPSGK